MDEGIGDGARESLVAPQAATEPKRRKIVAEVEEHVDGRPPMKPVRVSGVFLNEALTCWRIDSTTSVTRVDPKQQTLGRPDLSGRLFFFFIFSGRPDRSRAMTPDRSGTMY